MPLSRLFLMVISVFVFSADLAQAQSRRPYTSEFSFRFNYVEDENYSGPNGSSLEVDDDLGFGFAYLYNKTENFAIGGSFDWIGMNYTSHAKAIDPSNDDFSYSNRLYTYSLNFDAVYYLLNKPFSPFVAGSLGWTTIDSNIATGPSYGWCDWYSCYVYQPTKVESGFSYKLGLGLRWDVNRDFAVKGTYQWSEVDVDVAGENPNFTTWRLELVSRFY
ncbi:MAG: porin family protein [Ketobacter sp.]|nr:porin family protein [Ketobacter sp.]